MKLNFVHLCEYGFITNKGLPGIIGIFNRIEGSNFPIIYPSMTVVLSIQVNDKELHEVSIGIKTPSGKEIIKPINKSIGPADNEEQGLGLLATINNIKFEEEGDYEILILVDGKEMGIIPFKVAIK